MTRLAKRGEVTRSIAFERRVNAWGYSAGQSGQDHLLQKAVMLYVSKHSAAASKGGGGGGVEMQKDGTLTLTQLPAKQQQQSKEADNCCYDSDDDDDRYGNSELKNMEVSMMPPLNEWIEVGDGVRLKKIKEDEEPDGKSEVRKESTTLVLQAKGKDAAKRINALVDKAYDWYKGTLEAERDEKRYMFMMLHMPAKSDEGGCGANAVRLYKRYELSDEKTFSSLFFPGKSELLCALAALDPTTS